MSKSTQNILGLSISNFKKIGVFNVDLTDKSMVLVSGSNGQGKTSVIDAIHSALAGKSYFKKKIENVIKEGEEQADVIISTDKFEIHRYWKANGNDYIKIRDKDGIPQGSEETLLSRFYNEYSRDPHRMSNMDSKEQIEFMFELLGITDKLEELDEDYQTAYVERRDINRDLKKESAKLDSMDEFDQIPSVPDYSELSEELEKIQEYNVDVKSKKNAVDQLKQNKDQKQNEIDRKEQRIQEIEKQLEQAKNEKTKALEERKDLESRIKKGETWLKKNKPKDPSEVKEKLANVQEMQEKKRQAETYFELKKSVTKLEKKSQSKTIELDEIEKQKTELVNDREMPIDGMEFKDENILYNGTAVKDLSTSEKIIFWSKVFMSSNPELKFLTLDGGESLDKKSRKQLADFAEENELLYIVTVVDETQESGIVLEEGQIIKNNYKEEEK